MLPGERAWQPADGVTGATPLAPVLGALGFGQQDTSSFGAISEKMAARHIFKVADLQVLEREELVAMLRPLAPKLKKVPSAYVEAIGSAIAHEFTDSVEVKPERAHKKGGDTRVACTKVAPSADFNCTDYAPDGRVYLGMHAASGDDDDYMGTNEERLYLDRAWLDAGLHPEPSIGEYLPEGMFKTLEKAHRAMKLPPFKPDRKGKARSVPKIIRWRWQNGRQEGLVYKRIMLDETYKSALPPKMAARITWVPAGDDMLKDNELNDFVGTMVDVYAGKLPVRRLPTKPRPARPPAAARRLPCALTPRPRLAHGAQRMTLDEVMLARKNDESDASDNEESPVEPPQPPSPLPDDSDDFDLDGMAVGQAGKPTAGASQPPQLPKAGKTKPVSISVSSKKDQVQQKRSEGKGKPAAAARQKKKMYDDSSEDEDSDSDAENDSQAKGRGAGPARKPAAKKPKASEEADALRRRQEASKQGALALPPAAPRAHALPMAPSTRGSLTTRRAARSAPHAPSGRCITPARRGA